MSAPSALSERSLRHRCNRLLESFDQLATSHPSSPVRNRVDSIADTQPGMRHDLGAYTPGYLETHDRRLDQMT